MHRIKEMDFSFPTYVTPLAKDFISNLLRKKPQERMGLEEVPNHPWMQQHLPPPREPKLSDVSINSAPDHNNSTESNLTNRESDQIESHLVNLDNGTIDLKGGSSQKISFVSSQKLDYDDSFVEL